MAGWIKRLDPSITVILGGPHLTAVPEETMERFPEFDIGVIGEGEETVVDLLDALTHGRDLNEVEGILFRSEQNGCIRTPRRKFIPNLDEYPFPAWDLLPDFPQAYTSPPFKIKRSPAVSIVTSRGCPYRCIFCDTSVFGGTFRSYSAEYVVEMMKELYDRHKIREFIIEDDTFLVSKERAFNICASILKEGFDISWSCNSRVNLVSKDILRAMKKAGCWRICFGIESGNQGILDLERKQITLEQAEKAVAWTREAGMLAKGFFMTGHPQETEQTLRQTIDFAQRLKLSDVTVTALTPLPGSQLYAVADRYGAFDNDWRKMNLLNRVFVPFGLTEKTLEKYHKGMLRAFYLRPGIIGSYLNRIVQNPRLISGVMKGFAAFLKTVFKH
jgi:radical SAM superfamily enzyme YgiQ (UPF0313 family)